MALIAYPTDTGGAAAILLTKLRGGDVPLAQLAHAAYHFQGFAQGMFLPDTTPGGAKPRTEAVPGGLRSCDNETQLAACLEHCTNDRVATEGVGYLAAWDWKGVLKILVPLILQWLG